MWLNLGLWAVLAAPPWAGDWEVRYAQMPDQKPEWTAAGYLPAWPLTIADAARPEITWADDEAGSYRGWLLMARPLRLPEGDLAAITVALDYRTECSITRPGMLRSGQLELIAMTRDAWDRLARHPADARPLAALDDPGCLATALIHPNGVDVPDWTPARPVSLGQALADHAGETILLGIRWGAWHYGDRESGGFRNLEVTMQTAAEQEAAFWQAFDLTRPGLETLGAAIATGARAAAVRALAAWYRRRTTPVVANPVAPASDEILQRADETLAHTYRLAGCPDYTFPGPIVWNADPFNYEQWAIALNRHSEWAALAAAWLRTHDERYAREWAAQLEDWVAAMPVLIGQHWIEGPYNTPGRSPLSLDAGIRLGQWWFPTFEVLKASPAVGDETIYRFVRNCWDHAAYLLRPENFRPGSNWGAMESNGLYHLGVMLPEFRAAAEWRDTALARMTAELTRQVYPDGAQHELAPGYHGVTLGNFVGLLKLARANDQPLPPDYVDSLRAMYDYYLKIAMPDGRLPALNDSGWPGLPGFFRDALALFGEQPGYRWARSGGKEGEPPPYGTLAMPWAGWVIMRTGWDPARDRYLLFDAGPFGTGHQHEDKLGLILYAHGHRLLTEAGVYAYDESDWRRYVLSTRAHSTVRVDDRDQASAGDRSEYLATAPDTHGLRSEPGFDYARDSHTAGYGARGEAPDRSVAHRRRVLFVRPDYWVVIDDLVAAGDREHTATSQFLLDAPGARLDSASGTVLGDAVGDHGARLAIVSLLGAPDCRIAQGEKEPVLLGWLPDGFEQWRPAPAALYTQRFRQATQMAWALVPLAGDETPPVAGPAETTPEGTASISLRHPDGRLDRFTIGPDTLTAEAGDQRFEAREEPLVPRPAPTP